MEKLESKKHLRLVPEPDSLRWTPLISNYNITEEEKKAEKEVSAVNNYIYNIRKTSEDMCRLITL
jgi:hypothetical protein